MTVDYQIIEFRDAAKVRNVGLFSSSPLTLDVQGQEFREVTDVRINSVRSPEFIVLSPSRLLAQVPNSQLNGPIDSVAVFVASGRLASRAKITFEALVTAGKRAEGVVKLVQTYLKLLLTTPGRDIFMPNVGGGLLRAVGVAGRPADLKALGRIAVSNTQTQMIALQAQDSFLAQNERLQSATLLSVDFEPRTSTLALRIRLLALDGSTVDAGFTL